VTSALIASLALIVSGQYVRSRVDTGMPSDPLAHCLWWGTSTLTYRQNTSGNNETTGDSEFLATQRAFASWQAVSNTCNGPVFSEGPRTPDRTVGFDQRSSNNINIVIYRPELCSQSISSSDACWNDESCGNVHNCWMYRSDIIALTTSTYDIRTGQVFDSDIELNQGSFVFTTVNSPTCSGGTFTSLKTAWRPTCRTR
jgi:hypothetical protein